MAGDYISVLQGHQCSWEWYGQSQHNTDNVGVFQTLIDLELSVVEGEGNAPEEEESVQYYPDTYLLYGVSKCNSCIKNTYRHTGYNQLMSLHVTGRNEH